ncbi:HAE1 family hydrophobic/amphiphilic exporter-1 [Sediminihabitans luteus]|uniref:HAE1 family hydrophobic/amphiphilic exporter-1 n=1 Tax=Sediminihabitans luteus TaxID=1138585 RepID=A0A2M9CDG6_9CELL|nr:efflux RND transporter permease subunit [Sediminihabitans luteus]PJJ69902.1 HAE1 family hydrophobic/amphiphilic exporter-1 [Sediminihabitans luteus]
MDRLARLSLANRAVVALATIAVTIFGVLSLGSLKQELIPSISFPAAAVVGSYPGASPEIVADQVTEPVEAAAKGVDGVESVTSTASTGLSVTTVEFTYGTNMDIAAQQLQTAMTQAGSALPADVDPTVVTGSIDDLPVIQLAAAGGEDADDLANTLDTVLVPALEQIPDVRGVSVTGVADQAVTIDVDLAALTAAGLSPASLTTVLQDNGVRMPAGTITEDETTLSVQVGSPLTSLDALEALPLATPTGDVVALGDVATVTAGPEAATSYSRLDGEDSLAIAITKTPAGNTVDVSHEVQQVLDDQAEALDAAGVTTSVVFDQAPFIEKSIEDLATEGGLGLLFAVVVILLFLTSLRSTLVSAVSIPLSLLVTFVVMDLSGYTLNILTLGAMTVAIGRVVDDSIVVIENIKRHLSYGEEKKHAILGGVREVGGAITASTICTVAVFLPIAFVSGSVGELFRPFAMTITIALLASLFVALTIVPVLAYWFIRGPRPVAEGDAEAEAALAAQREAAETKERNGLWQRAYVPTIMSALRHPWITMTVSVAVLAGTGLLATRLETNFIGDSGQDTITVTESFESGTSLAAQDDAAREVEAALLDVPAVETVQTTVGSAGGPEAALFGGGATPKATFAITLDEDADGVAAQADVEDAVDGLGGDRTTDITVAAGQGGFGSSTVDLVVKAPDGDSLTTAAQQVQDAVSDLDGVKEVSNNLAAQQSTLQVTVDRDKAAAAGLTETQVSGIVANAMAPRAIGTVDLGDGPVDVTVLAGDVPATTDELSAFAVPTAAGVVPLAQIATIEEVDVPTSISRVDGARSATVSVTPSGQDIGALSATVTSAVDGLDLPPGATVEVGGVAADQADAFGDLGLALLAAIAIVYLVMVATFRSLLQPFILLVSIPFAATGALLLLVATSTPLGVPALIGMLMLIGIVVSNAIVLIDLINQYRERGRTLDDAVMEGSRKRLRPIVMTAAATIFALTPMALGVTGGGSFISQPLALVVIGGLLTSTLLTLVVVPVLYTLAARWLDRRADKRERRADAREEKKAARAAEADAASSDTSGPDAASSDTEDGTAPAS